MSPPCPFCGSTEAPRFEPSYKPGARPAGPPRPGIPEPPGPSSEPLWQCACGMTFGANDHVQFAEIRRRMDEEAARAAALPVVPTGAPPCPRCSAPNARPIQYGLPSTAALAAANRGELVLGGCTLGSDDAAWSCRECQAEFGRAPRGAGLTTGPPCPKCERARWDAHGVDAVHVEPPPTRERPGAGALDADRWVCDACGFTFGRGYGDGDLAAMLWDEEAAANPRDTKTK